MPAMLNGKPPALPGPCWPNVLELLLLPVELLLVVVLDVVVVEPACSAALCASVCGVTITSRDLIMMY